MLDDIPHKTIRTILGFDFGLRKIGIAVGQTFLKTANPIDILYCKNGIPDWHRVQKIIEEWQPQCLVIGLPLNMDGTPSPIGDQAQLFGQALHTRFKLPIFFEDERLTTKSAREHIEFINEHTQRKVKNKHNYKKQEVDAISACLIVEAYMNRLDTPKN